MGHVSRLLDDMLDVARIRHSKFQLGRERMFVSRALQIAVETVQPFVENAGQKLLVEEIDPGLEVDGDPFRLCQAFDNLLNNASKFSPRNSTITVEVRKNGFQAEVRFRDSGVGISAHEQPFVFDLFWQSPGESPNLRRGLGIGLALTRSIVELHGGTIVVESRGPGLGSTFIVRLPLAVPAHEPDAPAPLVRETASRRARVLVIDDNRDAAESLEQLVRMEGHDVIVAFDGPAGLSIAQEHPPDLVILDIGMPGMDGYEVCRQLRQRDWGADPLIAALSGWGQPEDRRRSQAAGFNVHFVKPLEHAQLLELLRMASERNASPESEDGPCASPIRSLTIDTRRLQDSPLSDPISFDGAAALGAPAEEAQGDAPG